MIQHNITQRKRVGVVLFQLGGPENLRAVQPFLYNLFCDPDIIDFPLAWLARKPLAWWLARRRSRLLRKHYAAIGGGSPIRKLTENQGRALEIALSPRVQARAVVAMRYWHPLTAEAIAELNSAPLEEIVLLPLYPHYSYATTRSSLKEWQRRYRPAAIPVRTIENFFNHPTYIEALAENINAARARSMAPEKLHLVFSAHSLPMSLVEQGDPYPQQIAATVRLVRQCGGWTNPYMVCYQSRVGRQRWLEPSLQEAIRRLAGCGAKHLLVIPISFVTEHIETLHEINIEAREAALAGGVEEFLMMPALNDSPRFMQALQDLVLKAIS